MPLLRRDCRASLAAESLLFAAVPKIGNPPAVLRTQESRAVRVMRSSTGADYQARPNVLVLLQDSQDGSNTKGIGMTPHTTPPHELSDPTLAAMSAMAGGLPPRCDDSWIQTASGRQFWPLNPRAEDICLEDIAHALSLKCRFTGHTKRLYTVGEHSLHCQRLAYELGCDTTVQAWALMHDAAEAYLPDVARPVKRMLVGFSAIEDRLMRVIAERYGLPWPMPEIVKEIDNILLSTERRDLMAPPPRPWNSCEKWPPLDALITHHDQSPRMIAHMFWSKAIKLGIEDTRREAGHGDAI
jgi:uncharacterized protein